MAVFGAWIKRTVQQLSSRERAKRTACLLSLILMGGCTSPPDPYRGSHSFADLASLLAPVKAADELTLYEGLPHQNWEGDLFLKELARTKSIEFAGNRYYAEPVTIDQATSERLRAIASGAESFTERPGGVVKACGGYHPDWRLEWKVGNRTIAMEFCFGCNDMKLYGDDELLIATEIYDPRSLESLLSPLRTNRPARAAPQP